MAESKLRFTKEDVDNFAKLFKGSIMEGAASVFMPEKIIKSADRTIVFWKDGTKTIVRRSDDTADDLYSAFCAALAKKVYGSNSQVKKILCMADIQPMSDRLRKKAIDEYNAYVEQERVKEESERPQKILDEYIDKDPIGTAMEEHKAKLQKRLAEQINEGIRRRRRTPI